MLNLGLDVKRDYAIKSVVTVLRMTGLGVSQTYPDTTWPMLPRPYRNNTPGVGQTFEQIKRVDRQ